MFDWFTKLFKQAEDVQQMAEDGIKSAQGVTDMIPGDADDKLVDSVAEKVEQVSDQIDSLKNNLPKS